MRKAPPKEPPESICEKCNRPLWLRQYGWISAEKDGHWVSCDHSGLAERYHEPMDPLALMVREVFDGSGHS